ARTRAAALLAGGSLESRYRHEDERCLAEARADSVGGVGQACAIDPGEDDAAAGLGDDPVLAGREVDGVELPRIARRVDGEVPLEVEVPGRVAAARAERLPQRPGVGVVQLELLRLRTQQEALGSDQPAEPLPGAASLAAAWAAVAGADLACDAVLLGLRHGGGEEVVVALQVAAHVQEPRDARTGDRKLEDARTGATEVGNG